MRYTEDSVVNFGVIPVEFFIEYEDAEYGFEDADVVRGELQTAEVDASGLRVPDELQARFGWEPLSSRLALESATTASEYDVVVFQRRLRLGLLVQFRHRCYRQEHSRWL